MTGIDIWNMAVLPFLFSNSQCWICMSKKALNFLIRLQNMFFSSLFHVPDSCQLLAFLWDTGTLTVENYITMKKLIFYHHLLCLPASSLANQGLTIQKLEQLPHTLNAECEGFLDALEITYNPQNLTKQQWKRQVSSKIHLRNKSYEKVNYETLSNEEYGLKYYIKEMTTKEAQVYFSSRAHMLPSDQHHFKNKHEYIENEWRCVCAGSLTCRPTSSPAAAT